MLNPKSYSKPLLHNIHSYQPTNLKMMNKLLNENMHQELIF